jgi:hypothetical protein
VNKTIQKFLEGKGIKLYHSFSHLKAFQAERAIRTLKSRLYRYMTGNNNSIWISGLQEITKSIKDSHNYAIEMASNNVSEKNVSQVWQNLYHNTISNKLRKPIFD